MDELISRQAAIDICRAPHMRNADCSDFEMAIMMLPPAELGTNLAEVGTGCSEFPNNSDAISRQAAIDALDVLCQEHRYKIPGKRETYSQYNEAWQDALDRAEGAIFNLPSAQPETHEKRTETHACDLISRQAAIDAVGAIKTLPPAEPKRGKWIDTKGNTEWYAREYECSECGGAMLGESNFCPNCGAKMEVNHESN